MLPYVAYVFNKSQCLPLTKIDTTLKGEQPRLDFLEWGEETYGKDSHCPML